MNEHETDLLAAAMNAARPDWPLKSLRSFIASKLAHRPYRDAFVALAWVATEPATHTPARVLEAGPWWRAAAVDGAQANHPERLDRAERCGICGKSKDRCEATEAHLPISGAAHDFTPDYRPAAGARRPVPDVPTPTQEQP